MHGEEKTDHTQQMDESRGGNNVQAPTDVLRRIYPSFEIACGQKEYLLYRVVLLSVLILNVMILSVLILTIITNKCNDIKCHQCRH